MKYFTIKELCKTSTGLDNTPGQLEVSNLKNLVDHVLDPLRVKYGKPITINSGYRSLKVNKKVGGVNTSQHCLGEAADITGGNRSENIILFNLIKDSGKYDQLINEYDYKWVHISYKTSGNRKQIVIVK